MAADVYTEPPHVGRGGWTWYTGSAGWMYQAGLEWILGFHLRGATLQMDPCIPRAWPGYEIDFRYHSARYEIVVENPLGSAVGWHPRSWTDRRCRAATPRSRSSTMAPRIGSGSSWADPPAARRPPTQRSASQADRRGFESRLPLHFPVPTPSRSFFGRSGGRSLAPIGCAAWWRARHAGPRAQSGSGSARPARPRSGRPPRSRSPKSARSSRRCSATSSALPRLRSPRTPKMSTGSLRPTSPLPVPRSRPMAGSSRSSSAMPSSGSSGCRLPTRTIPSERSGRRSGSSRTPSGCRASPEPRPASASGSTPAKPSSDSASPLGRASDSSPAMRSIRPRGSNRSLPRWARRSDSARTRPPGPSSNTRSSSPWRSRASRSRYGSSTHGHRGPGSAWI